MAELGEYLRTGPPAGVVRNEGYFRALDNDSSSTKSDNTMNVLKTDSIISLWRSVHLCRRVLVVLGPLFMVLAVTTETLLAMSAQKQGLSWNTKRLSYLWTFFPTAVFTMIVLLAKIAVFVIIALLAMVAVFTVIAVFTTIPVVISIAALWARVELQAKMRAP